MTTPSPSRTAPSASGTAAYPVAELERRFYAFVVDRLLDVGLCSVLALVLWQLTDGESPMLVVGISGGLLLALWLVFAVASGVAGLTPGKVAVGLRLVGQDTGAPIGVGKGLLRSIVLAAFGLPSFGFGLAALAWTAVADTSGQRRGWHDHLTGSVVVDVRQVPQADVEAVDDTPRHVVNLTAMRLVPAPAAPTPVRRPVDTDHSMRREPLAKDLSGPGTGQQPRLAPPVPPAAIAPPAPTPAPPPAGRAPVNVAPGAPTARPAASPGPVLPPAAQPPSRYVPGAVAPGQQRALSGPRWRATFDDGQTFVVEGLVLVGRRPAPGPGEQVFRLVPLSSPEMSVSKTHAQFGPATDGVIVVTDRGSTNGTVLVRQGVGRQLSAGKPATLRNGDKVMFGDRAMTLTLEG